MPERDWCHLSLVGARNEYAAAKLSPVASVSMVPRSHTGPHMSLSDLAALGSFVSRMAVLASLGFLYFQMRQITEQVRQAERNRQAIMQQGRAARHIPVVLSGTQTHLSAAARATPRGTSTESSVA